MYLSHEEKESVSGGVNLNWIGGVNLIGMSKPPNSHKLPLVSVQQFAPNPRSMLLS